MGVRKSAGRGRGLSPGEFLSLVDANDDLQRQTSEFRCRLTTPMYGGGVKAGQVDRAMPIRATAIRGQLRHWWRFLNRFDSSGHLLPAKILFKREREIWGGLGDADASSQHGALAKSQIKVSVTAPAVAPHRVKSSQDYPRARYAFVATDARPELLAPQMDFLLSLSFPEALRGDVDGCLRWWANFGGLGARTRRGLGAISVMDATGLPVPIPTNDELRRLRCELALVPCGNGSDPMLAWETALGLLANFRQGIPFARESGPGRSRWPEPDAIRRITGQHLQGHEPKHRAGSVFPRAFFGLPIIFHFKDGGSGSHKDPQDCELVPIPEGSDKHETRMASPLILRPILHDNRWHAGALRLPTDTLERADLRLRSARGHREHRRLRAGEWWNEAAAAEIPTMQTGEHPLTAFMRYFASNSTAEKSIGAGKSTVQKTTETSHATTIESMKRTFVRPRIKRNNSNGSIEIQPRDKQSKPITLIRDEAQRCFDALSETAKHHLRTSRQPLFNRLTITIDGNRFVELQEHAE